MALVLAGPAMAQNLTVTPPPPITASPLPAGFTAQPVALTRIAANIAPGTPYQQIGAPPFAAACPMFGEIRYWKEADNKVTNLESFDRIFREELKGAGFRADGDPTNLFEDHTASDLQVGALITGLQMKACLVGLGPTLLGASTMDIEWQVYSVLKAKVVARITTHGGVKINTPNEQRTSLLVTGAFADNVRRLEADEQFRAIVTAAPATASGPAATRTPISFTPSTRAMPIAGAAKSVVVIYAGDASGSGIPISNDGLILTNHHVAGDAGKVRVHWSDGTDTVGEVLRSDRRRDVALIRTTPKAMSLAIREDQPLVGEAVFAVGTPLEKDFENTVTKGVVSGNRTFGGLSFIQSDVAIDHGNSGGPLLDEKGQVLGIAQWGYAPDGVSHNLNFFIPIGDALRVLALTPTPAAGPRGAAAPAKARAAHKR
jgi:S1-C subfamily serine protease